MPFPDSTDHNVVIYVFQGKRPSKPRRFEAPGTTSAVWKVAKRCWHEKAKERPEVKIVLQDLESIANTGRSTHSACICLSLELIGPRSKPESNGNLHRSGNCGVGVPPD